jgi:5-methylcytosine-specific restriction endonuclease McrA
MELALGVFLDRIDNNKPYTLENSTTCCWRCNDMKGKYLTYEEMKMIWNYRNKNGAIS